MVASVDGISRGNLGMVWGEGVCGCNGGAVVVVEGECVAVMVVRWLWWRECV